MATAHFTINPQWLTKHIRELWAERRYRFAWNLLDCVQGMAFEQRVALIRGGLQLVPSDTPDAPCAAEDSWKPGEGYADPEEMLKSGACGGLCLDLEF